jgi:hypothetical protein
MNIFISAIYKLTFTCCEIEWIVVHLICGSWIIEIENKRNKHNGLVGLWTNVGELKKG